MLTFAERLRLRRRIEEVRPRAPFARAALESAAAVPDRLLTGASQLAADCFAGSFDAAGAPAVQRLHLLAQFMLDCAEQTRDLLAAARLTGVGS